MDRINLLEEDKKVARVMRLELSPSLFFGYVG